VVGDNPTETRWLASGGTATVFGAGAIADRTHPVSRMETMRKRLAAVGAATAATRPGAVALLRGAGSGAEGNPSTRPGKHRDRPSAFAVFSCHTTVAPHVHSVVVVHPTLVDRFMEIVDTLKETWQHIAVRTADPTSAFDPPRYANRTLHADVPFALKIRELMRSDPVGSRSQVRARIRRVVGYCAKLGRRRVADDSDFFTVLPTSPRRSVLTVRTGVTGHKEFGSHP
jgi:hypothetical protein